MSNVRATRLDPALMKQIAFDGHAVLKQFEAIFTNPEFREAVATNDDGTIQIAKAVTKITVQCSDGKVLEIAGDLADKLGAVAAARAHDLLILAQLLEEQELAAKAFVAGGRLSKGGVHLLH
jgi:hypothetical protein